MKASIDLLFVASQDRGGCTGLEVGAGRERCAEEGREVCKSAGMGYKLYSDLGGYSVRCVLRVLLR